MGHEQDLRDALREARVELWDANYIRRNDERREGEFREHWEARRKRNRQRYNLRERVVRHLRAKLDHWLEHKDELKEDRDGYATFDGKTVPAWMVPWLEKSRDAGWTGTVVSGVRTVAESIAACHNICGADRCPGLCAGASSNHNMEPNQGYPAGAIDVTDYSRFESIQFQIGSPLRNDLPIDPVHFSVSGH